MKKILFLVSVALMVSCMPKPTPPDDAIEESKMAKILADIHLTEAKINRLNLQSYDSSRVAYKEIERRIFKKYAIDSAQYYHTYNFYVANPELMIDVYKQSVKILEERKKTKNLD